MEKSISNPRLSVGELVEIKVKDSGYEGWIRATYLGQIPGVPMPFQFKPLEDTPPIAVWGFTRLLKGVNWRRLPN